MRLVKNKPRDWVAMRWRRLTGLRWGSSVVSVTTERWNGYFRSDKVDHAKTQIRWHGFSENSCHASLGDRLRLLASRLIPRDVVFWVSGQGLP